MLERHGRSGLGRSPGAGNAHRGGTGRRRCHVCVISIGVASEEVDVAEDTVHSRVVVRGQETPTGDGIKDLRPLTRSPSRRS